MQQKPSLTFWQIWNMSFGFLGIQFGFALQNANVSRIFQTLGASIDELPILWVAAPLTGLLVQPLIGYLSDNTWGRFGRRRPYFLIGAILASLALFAMPNSPLLWIAAGMLWILDASINVSMEPFRAFCKQIEQADRVRFIWRLQFFEEVIRENLDLGRPDKVQLIFERRISRCTPVYKRINRCHQCHDTAGYRPPTFQ